MLRGRKSCPRRWLELVTNVTNEEDMGPGSLRSVCLIERVENSVVLSQCRSSRQGDATGVSPSMAARFDAQRSGHGHSG